MGIRRILNQLIKEIKNVKALKKREQLYLWLIMQALLGHWFLFRKYSEVTEKVLDQAECQCIVIR